MGICFGRDGDLLRGLEAYGLRLMMLKDDPR